MAARKKEKVVQPERPFEGVRPKTENQKKLIHAIATNQVVFCTGPAGSGKTHISVAMAVQALREGRVKKIVVTRPMVTAGEQMGYLPGDMKDKIDPFLYPIYNEFANVLPGGKGELNRYLANGTIEILPIAFMRGVTLRSSFIIVDEAQNANYKQHKMIITRLAEDSYIVVNGDIQQSDLRNEERGDFSRFVNRVSQARGVAVVNMTQEDVVRSRIVKDILAALEVDVNA